MQKKTFSVPIIFFEHASNDIVRDARVDAKVPLNLRLERDIGPPCMRKNCPPHGMATNKQTSDDMSRGHLGQDGGWHGQTQQLGQYLALLGLRDNGRIGKRHNGRYQLVHVTGRHSGVIPSRRVA